MRVLQEELDDPGASDCGRCSVCAGPRSRGRRTRGWSKRRSVICARPRSQLEVKKMAPDAAGAMHKIPEDVRLEPGWALARFGDGGWWPAVESGLRSGTFEDEVVMALRISRAIRLARAGLADRLDHDLPSSAWATYRPAGGPQLAGALGRPARSNSCRASRIARLSVTWPTPRSRPPTCAAPSRSRQRPRRAPACSRRSPQLGLDTRDGRGSTPQGRGRRSCRSPLGRSASRCGCFDATAAAILGMTFPARPVPPNSPGPTAGRRGATGPSTVILKTSSIGHLRHLPRAGEHRPHRRPRWQHDLP